MYDILSVNLNLISPKFMTLFLWIQAYPYKSTTLFSQNHDSILVNLWLQSLNVRCMSELSESFFLNFLFSGVFLIFFGTAV